MFFLYLLIISGAVFGLALFCEKILHPYSILDDLVQYAVLDLLGISKGIYKAIQWFRGIDTSPQRYDCNLDVTMLCELRSIAEEYTETGFRSNIMIQSQMFGNVPSICIQFAAKRDLDEETLNYVGTLLRKKFNLILTSRNVFWKSFVTHYKADFVCIYIHYCELESDIVPFNQLFISSSKRLREDTDGFGIVYDAELEQEINKLKEKEVENKCK